MTYDPLHIFKSCGLTTLDTEQTSEVTHAVTNPESRPVCDSHPAAPFAATAAAALVSPLVFCVTPKFVLPFPSFSTYFWTGLLKIPFYLLC